MLSRKKSGQSIAEYAIVFGLVVAAAVAMQIYVKRGLQGKIKDAVDFTQNTGTVNIGNAQYEPYYSSQSLTSSREAEEEARTQTGGGIVRTTTKDITSRTGTVTTEKAQ
ncbi:MAG: hypothetical protein AABZ36_08330 [Nitrospirota bacterium]